MLILAIICAALSIVDVGFAIYFAMTDRVGVAWLLLPNFAVLGSLVVLPIFG